MLNNFVTQRYFLKIEPWHQYTTRYLAIHHQLQLSIPFFREQVIDRTLYVEIVLVITLQESVEELTFRRRDARMEEQSGYHRGPGRTYGRTDKVIAIGGSRTVNGGTLKS